MDKKIRYLGESGLLRIDDKQIKNGDILEVDPVFAGQLLNRYQFELVEDKKKKSKKDED